MGDSKDELLGIQSLRAKVDSLPRAQLLNKSWKLCLALSWAATSFISIHADISVCTRDKDVRVAERFSLAE